MECPRCHHVQEPTDECRACGVVVAKFEARKRAEADAGVPPTAPEGAPAMWKGSLAGFAVVAAVVLVGGFLLRSAHEGASERGMSEAEAAHRARTEADSPVEIAREATVRVESPWAKGAGFFVSEDCHVVTARSLVDPGLQRDELEDNTDDAERDMRRYREKVARLREEVQHGPANGRDRAQRRLEEARRELDRAEDRYHSRGDRSRDAWLRRGELSVTDVDGDDLQVTSRYYSDRRDLAMLWVDRRGCPYLEGRPAETAPKKLRVYALGFQGLGSPLTFRAHTRGIEDPRKPFLLIDRDLYRSVRGGPLVTVGGRVLGVNAFPERRRHRDGVAIPIEEVFAEFGSHLPVGLARK